MSNLKDMNNCKFSIGDTVKYNKYHGFSLKLKNGEKGIISNIDKEYVYVSWDNGVEGKIKNTHKSTKLLEIVKA